MLKFAFTCLLLTSPMSFADNLLKDPTRPLLVTKVNQAQASDSGYKLSSTKIGKNSRVANINGQQVRVGDIVDGATVISIGKQSALLLVANKELTLSIAERAGFSKQKSGK